MSIGFKQMSPEEYIKRFGNAYTDSQYENIERSDNSYLSQFEVSGLPTEKPQIVVPPQVAPAQNNMQWWYNPNTVLFMFGMIILVVLLIIFALTLRQRRD